MFVHDPINLEAFRQLEYLMSPERLADTTIREQWERAQKINIRGEPVDTTIDETLADGEWMKQNLARVKMALPNGYCGLPLQKSCPHANAGFSELNPHGAEALPEMASNPGMPSSVAAVVR